MEREREWPCARHEKDDVNRKCDERERRERLDDDELSSSRKDGKEGT
jgi:hypothetical protein